MFRAYNLTLSSTGQWRTPEHEAKGKAIRQQQAEKSGISLSKYIRKDGLVDASAMQDAWFPEIPAHIFFSHSHRDCAEVLQLAGWLQETFHLEAFIDSAAWGHAKQLLRQIDDEHCYKKDTHTYSYERRNGTTAHVHAMLSAALVRMMDRTECLFFINTPESISVSDAAQSDETTSSWIYTELSAAHTLRRLTPNQHRKMEKTASDAERRVIAEQREFTPAWKVGNFLDTFVSITADSLVQWEKQWRAESLRSALDRRQPTHPLDLLYSLTQQ